MFCCSREISHMTAHDEEKMAHFRSCTSIDMLTNSLWMAPGFIEARSSMKLFQTQLDSLHFNFVIDYEHILYLEQSTVFIILIMSKYLLYFTLFIPHYLLFFIFAMCRMFLHIFKFCRILNSLSLGVSAVTLFDVKVILTEQQTFSTPPCKSRRVSFVPSCLRVEHRLVCILLSTLSVWN